MEYRKMKTTERQKLILDKITEEYIASASPVSSQLLEEKYNFGLSPATIRIEMQQLTDKGYLYQPHTSAGRVPTDKAYRLFVNEILEKELPNFDAELIDEISQMEKEIKDSFKFIQLLTKRVAEISSNLAVSYLPRERVFLKEGWEEILKEPEFKDSEFSSKFIAMMENWEKELDNFDAFSEIKVYIGREISLPKARDFSEIISSCYFPQYQEGIIAILGPKRMDFAKNISLIKSLTKYLTKSK